MCAHAGLYSMDEGSHVVISDILPADVYPWDVESLMEQWLDENCSNGHFGRWTSYGNYLYHNAQDFTERLWSVWRDCGFVD